jgi:ubiquinone/menaquinone biosynthesis C-methylase UbiE
MNAFHKNERACEMPSGVISNSEMSKLWSTEARFYNKWRSFHRVRTAAMTEALIQAACIKSGMRVIDVACGPGEPAITLASVVGNEGKIVATDISEEMLSVARQNAEERGVTNVTFRQADAQNLPFLDCSFDAATCRLGAMYFSDLARALMELHRVLKGGSRAAFIAWGPYEKNPHWLHTMGVVRKNASKPSKYRESIDPFSLADPQKLGLKLKEAGFEDIRSELITIPYPWPGTPEQAWEWFSETSSQLGLFDNLDPDELKMIQGESIQAMYKHYNGNKIEINAVIVLSSGTKHLR